jgi:hypothetical protein
LENNQELREMGIYTIVNRHATLPVENNSALGKKAVYNAWKTMKSDIEFNEIGTPSLFWGIFLLHFEQEVNRIAELQRESSLYTNTEQTYKKNKDAKTTYKSEKFPQKDSFNKNTTAAGGGKKFDKQILVCQGCGLKGHERTVCRKKEDKGFNLKENVTWDQSVAGKAFLQTVDKSKHLWTNYDKSKYYTLGTNWRNDNKISKK